MGTFTAQNRVDFVW